MTWTVATRPDWRDPSHYPDPAYASLHRWAWEFLRRNPEFCAEFESASARERKMAAAGKLSPYTNRQPVGAALRRWGIRQRIWPEWRSLNLDTPVLFDEAPRYLAHTKINGVLVNATAMRGDRVALEFDIDAPIEPQIERTRRLLAANQKMKFPSVKRKRNQVEKFPLYLRVLDAQEADAGAKEMLEVFARDDENVDDRVLRYWTKRATALRDGGYRELMTQ